MLQQRVYLEYIRAKHNVVSDKQDVDQFQRLKQKVCKRICSYHQTIQPKMLPNPEEKQGNKQKTSVFGSNRNCLRPSDG